MNYETNSQHVEPYTNHQSQPQWRPFAKFTIFGTFLCLIVAYIYLYMTSPGTGGVYLIEVSMIWILSGFAYSVKAWFVMVIVTPAIAVIVGSLSAKVFRPRNYSSSYSIHLFMSIICSGLVTLCILTPLYQVMVCRYVPICG